MNGPTITLALALLTLPAMAQGSGWSFAPDQAVRVDGIDAGSTLNVRKGPGTSNPVVATLAARQTGLTILGCDDAQTWCRVDNGGTPLGWVAARYLSGIGEAAPDATATATTTESRFSESARLTKVTGVTPKPGGDTTLAELPPYLLGAWDADAESCAQADSETRITIKENGVRIGAATARFKTAIFRNEGYDLTTLLMQEQDVPNAVPQRALYRLEPDASTLSISGDVLATRRLRRCQK